MLPRLGHEDFLSNPFQFILIQHSQLHILCYWQRSKILLPTPPPKKTIKRTIISKHLFLLLNEQRSTHSRLDIAYFLLTSNIRLAVTLSSSSEGRNSLLCTTTNHTNCVMSFSQADKAFRSVTSCRRSGARFSAALSLSLSLARGPSLPTPATSHQFRRSPYLRTSLRT